MWIGNVLHLNEIRKKIVIASGVENMLIWSQTKFSFAKIAKLTFAKWIKLKNQNDILAIDLSPCTYKHPMSNIIFKR